MIPWCAVDRAVDFTSRDPSTRRSGLRSNEYPNHYDLDGS